MLKTKPKKKAVSKKASYKEMYLRELKLAAKRGLKSLKPTCPECGRDL